MHVRARWILVFTLVALAVGLAAQTAFAVPPTITSISPSARLNTGPFTMHIEGTALDTVDKAFLRKFGSGVDCGSATPDPILCVVGTNIVPDATLGFFVDATFDVTDVGPGSWDVGVSNPSNESALCSACLSIAGGSPTLSSASPNSRGQGATNENITITGNNIFKGATISFAPSAGITVNGSAVWNNRTSMTVNVSIDQVATTGARNVIVTNTDGDDATCTGCFTINAAPTATGATPASRGQGAVNQVITIAGTGFVATPEVSFSGDALITVNSVALSAGTLTANISIDPAAATGARNVTVRNPDHGVATCTACFTVNPKPTVTSTAPTNLGQGATAKTVTINGTNFDATVTTVDRVSFGDGITVTNLVRNSDLQLTATIDIAGTAPTGTHTVSVTNGDAGAPGTCACFTVNPAPTAMSAAPNARGQGATGQTIVVNGTGFIDPPVVTFVGGGVTIGSITFSATQLTLNNVAIAGDATTGPRDISIKNPDDGTAICTACFTINASPTLVAGGVTPSSRGQGASNQIVVLDGSNFDADPTVTISGDGLTINSKTVDGTTHDVTLDLSVAAGATASARDITVSNADAGTVVCTGCFTVNAAPVLAPPLIPAASQNNALTGPITINSSPSGGNFSTNFTTAGSVVLQKTGHPDVIGQNLTRVSNNQVTARFPINDGGGVAPGLWNLVLVNGDAGGPATCTNCFDVTANAPTLAAGGVSPSSRGAGAQNADITLTGSNFFPGVGVTFELVGPGLNGITVNSVTRSVATPTTVMTANISIASGAATGLRTISVTNTDGVTATCLNCFTVNAAPTANSVAPTLKPNDGPYTLTVTGAGFDNASGSMVLHKSTGTGVPDIVGTAYEFVSVTQVKATFDLNGVAPGFWDVQVTNGDGGGPATCGSCFQVVAGSPTVTGASPAAYGAGATAQNVVITGTNFFGGAAASFGDALITVNSTTRDSITQVTANITIDPTAAVGARTVRVTNTDGQFGTNAGIFSVAAGPTIAGAGGVVPDSRGAGATDQIITITGTNFGTTPAVSFGDGVTVTSVSGNATSLTVHIDVAGSALGARDVTVTNGDQGRAVCDDCFTITAAPTLSTVAPSSRGQGATDQSLVLTGTGFEATPTVTFSGTDITVDSVTTDSATQLTVVIDVGSAAATGARNVTLTNPDAGSFTLTDGFTVNAKPTATTAAPDALGQGASNEAVVVTGTGFAGTPGVTISGTGITVDSVVRDSATQLTLQVSVTGAATTGLQTISVTNPDGGVALCNCFTINAAPTATSADPSSRGQGASNQEVEITGTGFVGTPGVVFSGTGITVDDVVWNSATLLTATIDVASGAPLGARDITVTNPDHGTPAVCTGCFTVNAAPTATLAAPASAPNTGPVTLTITGTGFDDGTGSARLRRAGEPDIVGTGYTFNSPTEVEATFNLSGAAPGAWHVIVNNGDGGEADCACFTVTAGPPTVTSANPSSRAQGATNQNIVVTGTNFFGGATGSFSGTGITVNSTTVTDSTHVTLNITIASNAPTGQRQITITNSDLQAGSCPLPGCFTVLEAAPVTITAPTTLTGPVTATFIEDVSGVTTDNFTLEETSPVVNIPGSVACKNAAGVGTLCSGSSVRSATFTPDAHLIPNQAYTARINPAGNTTILANGGPVPTTSKDFRASKIEQETSAAALHLWDLVRNSNASSGNYRRARLKGEFVSMTVTGQSARLYFVTGPDQGKATITLGTTTCTVNLYATARHYKVGKTCAALTSATRELKITVLGQKGSTKGTNTFVSIDAIRMDAGPVVRTPPFTYALQSVSNSNASGGKYAQDDVAGSEMRFTFRGTTLKWWTAVGPSMGKAKVYIDGAFVGAVDNYDRVAAFDFYEFSGPDGVHTVKIVVLGAKNAASRGTRIIFDRFVVS